MRVIEDWETVCKCCGVDEVSLRNGNWIVARDGWASKSDSGIEVEIHTDPTKAPADALQLEAEVEYVRIGDLKPGDSVYHGVGEGSQSYTLVYDISTDVVVIRRPKPTKCPKCNGAGEVHGALGVGIMWPCTECDGKGVA